MKIQILSDLHNEFEVFHQPQVDSDVVVLAGDIDLSVSGFTWARKAWPNKAIIYVPGNHEYYNSDIDYENEQMAKAGEVNGIYFLNRGEVVIQGTRFLGCSLWTDFALFGESEISRSMSVALNGLTDFITINYNGRRFNPADSLKLHKQDRTWLETKLKEPFDGKTVVITHHLPSALSVAKQYKKHPLSACFASNLDHLFGFSNLWIHGHTHDSFDYTASGTRVVCNPRGYSERGRRENLEFDSSLVVDL
ncbi:MAG: metallophosphoesterase family protein [Nitrospirae bacterium]|nr:metallophosphoesterase family protein [Nitrospirota bacterium]